jgi:hypothetical protein
MTHEIKKCEDGERRKEYENKGGVRPDKQMTTVLAVA